MNSCDLETLRNLTLQKIGRNLVNLQKMEGMLKYLISRSSISGKPSDLRANMEKSSQRVSKMTMGNLIKEYTEKLFHDEHPETPDDEFSFSVRIEMNEDDITFRKNALAKITEERNHLIHHMLSEVDLDSLESCQNLSLLLDEQATKIDEEYKILQAIGRNFLEAASSGLNDLRESYKSKQDPISPTST